LIAKATGPRVVTPRGAAQRSTRPLLQPRLTPMTLIRAQRFRCSLTRTASTLRVRQVVRRMAMRRVPGCARPVDPRTRIAIVDSSLPHRRCAGRADRRKRRRLPLQSVARSGDWAARVMEPRVAAMTLALLPYGAIAPHRPARNFPNPPRQCARLAKLHAVTGCGELRIVTRSRRCMIQTFGIKTLSADSAHAVGFVRAWFVSIASFHPSGCAAPVAG
jgi:hypothetical protein